MTKWHWVARVTLILRHGDWDFAPAALSATRSTSVSAWFSEWASISANCFGGFSFIGNAGTLQSEQHGEEPSIEKDPLAKSRVHKKGIPLLCANLFMVPACLQNKHLVQRMRHKNAQQPSIIAHRLHKLLHRWHRYVLYRYHMPGLVASSAVGSTLGVAMQKNDLWVLHVHRQKAKDPRQFQNQCLLQSASRRQLIFGLEVGESECCRALCGYCFAESTTHTGSLRRYSNSDHDITHLLLTIRYSI